MASLSAVPTTGIPSSMLHLSFVILVLVIVAGLYMKRIVDKKIVMSAILAEYLFIVLCSTVLFRPLMKAHEAVFSPLWVYFEQLNEKPCVSTWDIYVNIVLLMPVGVLLAGIKPFLKWYKVLFAGVLCSFTIEVLQFMLKKGFFQLDDILHNCLGCMIGWWLASMVLRFFLSRRERSKYNRMVN